MQTWALLVDSYRLLLSRKLFWITLVISAIVVLIYGSIGFDETGWFIFFGAPHFDSELFKQGSEWSVAMYLGIFNYFIVGFWLTWAATILALISTSPIFSDFMADGSIDLVLSKPLGRVRVFFVKYLGGLLFVVLQVALFTLGVFVCVGWRVGHWNPSIFLAIPLVVVFFSYLYSVSVLMTMVTRSALASLLFAGLFWFVMFGVDRAERLLNDFKIRSEVMAEFPINRQAMTAAAARRAANRNRASAKSTANAIQKKTPAEKRKAEIQRQEIARRAAEKQKQSNLNAAESYTRWRDYVRWALAVLPKTKQTTDLIERWTVDSGYTMEAIMLGASQGNRANNRSGLRQMQEAQKRTDEDYRNQSGWYVLGTSLGFEAIVLAFACFLFVRKDF